MISKLNPSSSAPKAMRHRGDKKHPVGKSIAAIMFNAAPGIHNQLLSHDSHVPTGDIVCVDNKYPPQAPMSASVAQIPAPKNNHPMRLRGKRVTINAPINTKGTELLIAEAQYKSCGPRVKK